MGMEIFIIILLLCLVLYPTLIKYNIININNFTNISRYHIIKVYSLCLSILIAGIGVNYLLFSPKEVNVDATVMPMIQGEI